MNTKNINEVKNEIKGYLAALKKRGMDGRRLAFTFEKFAPNLKRYAMETLGASEFQVEAAFSELLMVRSFELDGGLELELDIASFESDMRAFANSDYNPDSTDGNDHSIFNKEDAVVDDVLSPVEKESLYKMCSKVAKGNLQKYGASKADVQDIASGMYARLLSRRVNEFERGVPGCDAEWYGFLRKDVEFARMNFYREHWRHPTSSLDEIVVVNGREDEPCEERKVEVFDYDAECIYQPNRKDDFLERPEAKFELRFVQDVCAKIGARSSRRTKAMINDLILDEASVEEVSSKYGIKANAIYAAKKRFMDAMRDGGESALAEAEACAA